MLSVLNETLLERGERGGPRVSRRVWVAATIAGLLLSASFAGYSAGKMSPHADADDDFIHAKLASIQNVHTNQTELTVVAYSTKCYGFTGGICTSEFAENGCHQSRNATCADLKCVCPGGCTDANGVCTSQTYTKVASKITLSPQKWNGHWLYMQSVSLLSQLKVSNLPSFSFFGSQYFDVYELPGRIKGKKHFFLASNKWPSWVAAMRSTGSVLSASVSPYGLYGVSLEHTIAPWDPQGVIVEICSYPGSANVVMIGNAPTGVQTEWAYVHHASWFVYGWGATSDPGDGGYWVLNDANGADINIGGLDAC